METTIKITKDDINPQLLEIIRNMFSPLDNELIITIKSKNKIKQALKPMTIEEYNKRLELSEEFVKNGKIYTQEQVLNHIQSWKKNLSM